MTNAYGDFGLGLMPNSFWKKLGAGVGAGRLWCECVVRPVPAWLLAGEPAFLSLSLA